jgi:hypothetical protein
MWTDRSMVSNLRSYSGLSKLAVRPRSAQAGAPKSQVGRQAIWRIFKTMAMFVDTQHPLHRIWRRIGGWEPNSGARRGLVGGSILEVNRRGPRGRGDYGSQLPEKHFVDNVRCEPLPVEPDPGDTPGPGHAAPGTPGPRAYPGIQGPRVSSSPALGIASPGHTWALPGPRVPGIRPQVNQLNRCKTNPVDLEATCGQKVI